MVGDGKERKLDGRAKGKVVKTKDARMKRGVARSVVGRVGWRRCSWWFCVFVWCDSVDDLLVVVLLMLVFVAQWL